MSRSCAALGRSRIGVTEPCNLLGPFAFVARIEGYLRIVEDHQRECIGTGGFDRLLAQREQECPKDRS